MASESNQSRKFQNPEGARFSPAAAIELTRRDLTALGLDAPADDDSAETEIQAEFRRKLTGLRRLPRQERAHALRAAREWRFGATNALREKRARDRDTRNMLRQLQKPAPH